MAKIVTWYRTMDERGHDYKDGGKYGGCCNARCYDSHGKEEKCQCICGGENHGVGYAQAVTTALSQHTIWEARAQVEVRLGNIQMGLPIDTKPPKGSRPSRGGSSRS